MNDEDWKLRTDRTFGTGWLCREYMVWWRRLSLEIRDHYLDNFRKFPKPKGRKR